MDEKETKQEEVKTYTCKETFTFMPIGNQEAKAKSLGYHFTEGQKYPVFERNTTTMTFKTVDDSGKERWIKDEYFVPANRKLVADEQCKFDEKGWPLEWNGLHIDTDVPDIRKINFEREKELEKEKGFKVWSESDLIFSNPDNVEDVKIEDLRNKEFTAKDVCGADSYMDAKIMAGLDGSRLYVSDEEIANVLKKPKKRKKIKKTETPNMPEWEDQSENSLLYNIDKLWEKIGNVFPEYRTVDTDNLMTSIQTRFPGRNILWDHGILKVDGAKTKIFRSDVVAAFDGLKKMITPKMAEKLVAKIVVDKLKKLF